MRPARTVIRIAANHDSVSAISATLHHHRWTEWSGKDHLRKGILNQRGGGDPLCESGFDRQRAIAVTAGVGSARRRSIVSSGARSIRANRADFAFESTLSGLTYVTRLKLWKAAGWRIEIVYLRISSPQLALRRIAARVKQGGHNVPRRDVLRRFTRSRNNFRTILPSFGSCVERV